MRRAAAVLPHVGDDRCDTVDIAGRQRSFHHYGVTDTDHAVTWLPCRLTVLTLALWSDRPLDYLHKCRQDATQDPSPNSGWSEAAFAWLLQVRLGGTNVYQGVAKIKPFLGQAVEPLTPEKVLSSTTWSRRIVMVWVAAALSVYWLSRLSRQ